MPSWYTTLDPMFGRGEGAQRALEALRRFAKLLQIPKRATWAVHRRGIGLVVVAEWPYDELWVGQTCLICGETGPLHEHVHFDRSTYANRSLSTDSKTPIDNKKDAG